MSRIELVDKYNENKIWVVSKSKCRHYYMEQYIGKNRVSKKVRTSRKHLLDIGLNLEGIGA